MKMIMNPAIARMASEIGCDYLFALGLFMALDEAIKGRNFDALSDDRFVYELGYMSQQMSRKLSQIGRDKMCDMYRDTKRDIKRDNDRDRQRDYRERKRSAPSSPPSPTPLSPLLSPQEKERGNAPLSLRDRPPEGAHTQKKRFSAPSVDDVQAYADEKGYKGFEASRFVDFYASKGWVVGKSPMKDWKAAVRNWMRGKDAQRTQTTKANQALDYEQREYKAEDYGDDFFYDVVKEYGGKET